MTTEEIKVPASLVIPSEEEERAVRTHNGFVFAHDARHCRIKHLWPKDQGGLKPEWREPIERYLAAFCEPVRTPADEIVCVACGEQVTAHHVGIGDYRYRDKLKYKKEGTWECRCAMCAYPGRMKHTIFFPPTGEPLVQLIGFPLFYHPTATQQIT
jgi:hypothetical protein